MDFKIFRPKFFRLSVIFFLVCFSFMPARNTSASFSTRFVSSTGNDTGSCTDFQFPCQTIQYAVNQSAFGDKILVAQGVYKYNSQVDFCSQTTNMKPASVVCFVDKGLTILGGFSITNWLLANPSENLTIIDGEDAYRGVSVIGYNTSSSYLIMEGFTIQNGLARGPTGYDSSGIGGGMLVQKAVITLNDMIFKNNKAIGQNTDSFDGGAADGAGIRIESSPPGTSSFLQHVTFENNQSLGGTGPDRGGVAFGALFVYQSTVTIEDSIFTNNLAQGGNSTGSGISRLDGLHADALGGAIGVANGTVTLRRIVMTGNQAKGGNGETYGGGAYGGGIFVEGVSSIISSLTLSDSYVVNNSVTAGNAATGGNAAGGGIVATNSLVALERVKVILNSAIGGSSSGGGNAGPGAGGGIYLFSIRSGVPSANMKNVIISDNFADQGIGVRSLGNGGGGGIIVHGMNADILHATIAKNRIGTDMVLGQGLVVQPWVLGGGNSLPAIVNLNNSIIADHTQGGSLAAAIVVQQGSTLNFDGGMFAGNLRDTNIDNIPVNKGIINGLGTMLSYSSADFVSPNLPDSNFHLRVGSEAIDKAPENQTILDIDRQNRPYNNVSDFGADEYWPFPLLISPTDSELSLDWSGDEISLLSNSVSYYEVIITCEIDANPPEQGNCGQPINVGLANSYTLSGLSNFKEYSLVIHARDSFQNLIATSFIMTGVPTNIFIYLPLIMR